MMGVIKGATSIDFAQSPAAARELEKPQICVALDDLRDQHQGSGIDGLTFIALGILFNVRLFVEHPIQPLD